MPRAKGAAKAKAAAAKAAAAGPPPDAPQAQAPPVPAPLVVAVPPSTPPSTAILLEIEECVKMIQAHEGLADIASLTPLGIGEGAACAAFKITDFQTSLNEAGTEYVSTGNFGWVDWKYTNSPGVPVLRNSIVDYATAKYSDFRNLASLRITVAVPAAKPLPSTIFPPGGSAPAIGSVMAMTPQEQVLAPYWALGAALKKGTVAESDVEAWRKFFCTTLFTWKVLPSTDDQDFETIGIRQEAALTYNVISYTPVQWVCKVMQMKSARETTGNKISSIEMATLFKKRGFKPAKGQEDISVTFIDNAVYVWGKALCYPEVGSARENMEELNPQCDIVLSMRTACALWCALLAQCNYEDQL